MKVFIKEDVKVSFSASDQRKFKAGEQEVTEEEAKVLEEIGYLGKSMTAAKPTAKRTPSKKVVKGTPDKTKSSS